MNYGHQPVYNTTQTENDFTFLKSNGVGRLRIFMPTYNDTTDIPHCQDMIARALAHGFYVVWGVSTSGVLTATVWSAWKSYVTGTLVPWATSNGLPELCLGNEFELHTDGTTLTSATVRSDLRSMASSIKAGGFTGKISYSTSVSYPNVKSDWIAGGIGSLDYIAWNIYADLATFDLYSQHIVSQFGSANTYVSEFNSISGGYPDFNDETLFYNDTLVRVNSIRNAGVQSGYFFCFRDGGFGVPANSFGLVQTKNTANWAHYALKAITGQRIYALRAFGTPVQFGTGLMSVSPESVLLSDASALANNRTIAPEPVSVTETSSFTGLPSPVETATLVDSTALVGKSQIVESTSISDLSLLKAYKWYAIRTFGSPVKIPLPPKKYALRTFGSPVRYTPHTVTRFTAPPDYVLPSDSVTLLNSLNLFVTIKRYAMRTFGSPVKYTVRPEVASIADIVFSSSSTVVASENVSLSDATLSSGVPISVDSVNALELTTSLLGSMQNTDNSPISDASLPTGQSSIVDDAVQPGESTLLSGVPMPTDSVSLADQFTLQGVTSVASESAQLGETTLPTGQPLITDTPVQPSDVVTSLVGNLSSADLTQLTDQVNLLGSTQIAFENAGLGESTLLTGQPSTIDSVSASESVTATLGNMSSFDTAPIADQSKLLGTTSIAFESVQISENSSQAGQPSLSESVQFGESNSQIGQSQIIDIVPLGDQYTLLGSIQIAPDSAQLSELLNSLGLPQLSDFATLGESVSYFTTVFFVAPPESVSLSDLLLSTESTHIASESIQLSEQSTLQGGRSIAPEQVSLLEFIKLLGITNSVDSALLSDLVSASVYPNTNMVLYARGGNIAIYTRQGNSEVFTRSGNIILNEE